MLFSSLSNFLKLVLNSFGIKYVTWSTTPFSMHLEQIPKWKFLHLCEIRKEKEVSWSYVIINFYYHHLMFWFVFLKSAVVFFILWFSKLIGTPFFHSVVWRIFIMCSLWWFVVVICCDLCHLVLVHIAQIGGGVLCFTRTPGRAQQSLFLFDSVCVCVKYYHSAVISSEVFFQRP